MSLEECSVTRGETLQVNLTVDSLAGYLIPCDEVLSDCLHQPEKVVQVLTCAEQEL